MASGYSHLAAALAVASVGRGCWLLAPAVDAGQKIEFSSPAIPLRVPQQEREVKDVQNTAGKGSFGPAATMDPGYPGILQATIIIPPSKAKEKRAWVSSSGEDGQRESGARLNMLPGQDGLPGMTNGWDSQKGLNSSAAGSSASSLSSSPASSLAGGRDGSENGKHGVWERGLPDRDGNRRDDQLGRAPPNEGGAWSLMRGSLHDHSPMALERLHEGEFGGKGEVFDSAFEPPAAGGRLASQVSLTDPEPTADTPLGFGGSLMPDNNSQREQDGTFGTPPEMRAWDTPTAGWQPSQRAAGWEAPATMGQGPVAPPAVLPFPKRPGSLFQ